MQPQPTTVTTKRPEIKPRAVEFAFDASVPRFYCRDPFMSHFFSGLSVLFPAGERFFVDSVRRYRDRIEDPVLRREVVGFSAQEAKHSKEHEDFTVWLDGHGYDATSMERFTGELLELLKKRFPETWHLAGTCALEHFTSTLAALVLEDEQLRAEFANDELLALWTWHALEEMEHKSVAYDVYQAVSGSYAIRVGTHVLATAILWPVVGRFMFELMRTDGLHTNAGLAANGLQKLFVAPGYLTKLVPAWLDYFRPDFHPTQHDHEATLVKWRTVVEGRMKARVAAVR